MLQGSYADIISALSVDQSNQSDYPNDKITPTVLFPVKAK